MTDDELKRLFEASAAETRRAIDALAQRMESGFSSVDSRMGAFEGRMGAFESRMETRIASSESETRRQFGVALEAMKHEVETVAELVLETREQVVRVQGALEEKIDHTAAETQSMIKFSHQELDRRVTALENDHRALEETVAELQARVQRLENATH